MYRSESEPIHSWLPIWHRFVLKLEAYKRIRTQCKNYGVNLELINISLELIKLCIDCLMYLSSVLNHRSYAC